MVSFQKLSPLVAAALLQTWNASVESFHSHHHRSHFHSTAAAAFPRQQRRPIFTGPDLNRLFATSLLLSSSFAASEGSSPAAPTPPLTLETLAKRLADGEFRNVVVLIGAGMSVSAGIPDFRTPGTGLYSKLEEYNLPYPEAIFELQYFRQNPAPFVDVARAIWPGQESGPKPTLAHSFVALLEQRSVLKRVYTQNIDGLERLAGVSHERLIECHGHFSTCSCTNQVCPRYAKHDLDIEECYDTYMKGQSMTCPDCGSLVKPDIVFFGEELPSIFMRHIHKDMDDCDLLLVMGTSLLVAPVASIPNWVGEKVPRILINRDLVGSFGVEDRKARRIEGYQTRDVFAQGDCDDGARKLCELAGNDWVEQLEEMHSNVATTI